MKKSSTGNYIFLINSDESTDSDWPYDSSDKINTKAIAGKKIVSSSKYLRSSTAIFSKLINA